MKKFSLLLTYPLVLAVVCSSFLYSKEESWSDWVDVGYSIVEDGVNAVKPHAHNAWKAAEPYVNSGIEKVKDGFEKTKEYVQHTKVKVIAEKEIWTALQTNDQTAITLAVKKGANINCKGPQGEIPLHRAAASGNLGLVKLLVSLESTIEHKDNNGLKPIDIAQNHGHSAIVNYLRYATENKK